MWSSQVLPGKPADFTNPIALTVSVFLWVFYKDRQTDQLAATFWGPSFSPGGYSWQGPILLGGNPTGYIGGSVYPANGVGGAEIHVYFAQPDGSLHQKFLDANGSFEGPFGLPGTAAAENLGVSAQTYVSSSNRGFITEQHVFFRENSGSLGQVFTQNSSTKFVPQTLPGLPIQVPSVVQMDPPLDPGAQGANVPENIQAVFFEDENHEVRYSWYDGAAWGSIAPIPAQTMSPVIGGAYPNNGFLEQHAFFIGPGGELHQIWQDANGYHQQGLGVYPSQILGTGNYYPRSGGWPNIRHGYPEQHVFWRDSALGLHQSWYNGVTWATQPIPTVTPVHKGSW